MIVAGCDVGSLTAKAFIMNEKGKIAGEIIRVRSTTIDSATEVMEKALASAKLRFSDLDYCCSTGYGRYEIPFAQMNMSEISCHGLGAFRADQSIRTIIDIGGQDCKIILIDAEGNVLDFIMNDKCAAGTGRSLEILAKTIGLDLEELGDLAIKSKKPINITNKCSIFMELEVLNNLYTRKKLKHIACGIADAVAKRVAYLAKAIDIEDNICITGGVSKNPGVVRQLAYHMNSSFTSLPVDPQIIGAFGAAFYAMQKLTMEPGP
ncbi:MAG: 2-hydroxyglutaryl-CoA dehydratase [Deltaproteobacteria bacterium HGW-Deltaproteobacteria-13]|jgi:predicted CoA-substrate-specific enzyme activase|nr:MAG: 2-hydroxyglutaryl-CoA dehydratase [Deltaproteobacteria bacterium HGW-Deltaproteobacteria-13]